MRLLAGRHRQHIESRFGSWEQPFHEPMIESGLPQDKDFRLRPKLLFLRKGAVSYEKCRKV